MKKKQVNFAEELNKMGEALIEGFTKGIEEASREQMEQRAEAKG